MYDLRMLAQQVCECADTNKAVIAPFVYYTGLSERLREPQSQEFEQLPRKFVREWVKSLSGRDQCLASLKKTCDFYTEEVLNNEVIGAMGIGIRKTLPTEIHN